MLEIFLGIYVLFLVLVGVAVAFMAVKLAENNE